MQDLNDSSHTYRKYFDNSLTSSVTLHFEFYRSVSVVSLSIHPHINSFITYQWSLLREAVWIEADTVPEVLNIISLVVFSQLIISLPWS